jgi:hypothetical protein
MTQNGLRELVERMRHNRHQRLEWSRSELIDELEQVGMGPREADRVITRAETLGLLGLRPVGKGHRKRFFLKEETKTDRPKRRTPAKPRRT